MGKAKSRNFYQKSKSILPVQKRSDVLKEIIEKISDSEKLNELKDLISLFGISPEELTEAGCSYEQVKALGKFL